jgi:hypothetical protein
MGQIVNLRIARKRSARRKDDERAAANRAQHGRSKAERLLVDAQRDKADRELDQHRIQDGEES